MSLQIQGGLFTSDFTDHHAILGVPVDADPKDIRKRYLKIARTLHPDSFLTGSDADRQKATEILSKLVIPANEKLSQDKERAEYAVILRLKGQQVSRQQSSLQISEAAKEITKAPDVDVAYKKAVQQLAEQQYAALDKIQEITAQISELNLVYLLHKAGKQEGGSGAPRPAASTPSPTTSKTATPTRAGQAAPPPPPPAAGTKSGMVDGYCRRAEDYIKGKNLAKAVLELRDALQLEPNNARCHSLLGTVYLMQNQATMAKIHINKALQINPNEPTALEAKKKLEGGNAQAGKQAGKPAAKPAAKPAGKPDNKSGGGFFGLFGGKKK